MRMLRSLLLVVACVLSLLPAAHAAQTPEAFFESYTAAIKERGWRVTPEFIHPDELARFKAMLLPLLTGGDEAARQEAIRMLFGPAATPQSISAMPPIDFMRTFMSYVGGELDSVNFKEFKLIGTVREGENVHLVTRNTVGGSEVTLTQMDVVSLKPLGDSWRLMLTGDMEGMAQAIKAQTAGKR